MKAYMVSEHEVGSTEYYHEAIMTGYYGVEDDGRVYKLV